MGVAADLTSIFTFFEKGKEGVFALVAEDVSDVLFGVVAVVGTQGVHCPEELHDRLVLDRSHPDQLA